MTGLRSAGNWGSGECGGNNYDNNNRLQDCRYSYNHGRSSFIFLFVITF